MDGLEGHMTKLENTKVTYDVEFSNIPEPRGLTATSFVPWN